MPNETRSQVAVANLTSRSHITATGEIGTILRTTKLIQPGEIVGFTYGLSFFLSDGYIPLFYNQWGMPLDPSEIFLDIRRYFIVHLHTLIASRINSFVQEQENQLTSEDGVLFQALFRHPLTQLIKQFETDEALSFEQFESEMSLLIGSFGRLMTHIYLSPSHKKNPLLKISYRSHLEDFVLLNRILTEPPEKMYAELHHQFIKLFPKATDPALFRIQRENIEASNTGTPLRTAGFFAEPILEALVKKYNLPDYSQPNLEKALRNAAANNQVGDLKILIRYVKNINAVDANPTSRKTALHWACERQHIECIQLLLDDRNIDPTIKDARGREASAINRPPATSPLKA